MTKRHETQIVEYLMKLMDGMEIWGIKGEQLRLYNDDKLRRYINGIESGWRKDNENG